MAHTVKVTQYSKFSTGPEQPQKAEPSKAKKPAADMEGYTIDVRDFGGFSEQLLDKMEAELNQQGKHITQIYCRNNQAEKIKKFDKYKDVKLTVE